MGQFAIESFEQGKNLAHIQVESINNSLVQLQEVSLAVVPGVEKFQELKRLLFLCLPQIVNDFGNDLVEGRVVFG